MIGAFTSKRYQMKSQKNKTVDISTVLKEKKIVDFVDIEDKTPQIHRIH